MKKLWAGRQTKETSKIADDFNSSISIDRRMVRQDIIGSAAHAGMLVKCGIIPKSDGDLIISSLGDILADIESGKLKIDLDAEDIHMFVEHVLTERIGDTGKMLHTARSRNDQVALDLRLYLRDMTDKIRISLLNLMEITTLQAQKNKATVMPGYTHLQRAQPITFGHHLMAYVMMFERDFGRFEDTLKRMDVSPIGCCALAGTTYPTDRVWEAEQLGFSKIAMNSLDGVSDRDFCIEFISACSMLMMHLSRLSEELILWSSWEFQFITLDDSFTTGSSIMPQKKNPDMAELCRGKTGRVYGNLMALLTTLKGLPLAYNKDMQEDKEAVFDSADTVFNCLNVFAPMIESLSVNKEKMTEAAQKGFINATDLADYLTKKGMAFRDAYKLSGRLVAYCIEKDTVLERLPLETLQVFSSLFEADVYDEISLTACIAKRTSEGGTSVSSVEKQIQIISNFIENKRKELEIESQEKNK